MCGGPSAGGTESEQGTVDQAGAEGLGTSAGSRVSRAEELMGAEPSRQRTPREKLAWGVVEGKGRDVGGWPV